MQRRINSKSHQPPCGRRAFAKRASALAVGLIFVALASPALVANTYVVNSTLDEPDADPLTGVCSSTPSGKCTLRAAIMLANFVPGPNTITVPSGTYLLTRPGYDDDALVGDLDIKHDLTIHGAGSGATIIDGNGSVTHDRVFQILSTVQNVTMSGMTIRNGESLNSTVGVIGGGGLYIEGTAQVHLSDVIFDSNTGQNGGGIYANFSSFGGSLELDHVILHANRAIAGGVGAGGGVFAYLPSSLGGFAVRDSRVYSNSADGTGGGLYVQGNSTAQWTIERSEFYSNTAASGGGIGNFVPLILSDSSLHDNHVTFDGGAMEAFAPFTMNRTALNANSAGRFGGGIFGLQDIASGGCPPNNAPCLFGYIVESTLSGNVAQYGGGIYHDGFITPSSLLKLVNSTVSGNTVFRPSGATGKAEGGGIYMYLGHAELLNSTVANNRVQLGFGIHIYPGEGGGLYIFADPPPPSGPYDTFIAQNSLIANNTRGNGITVDTNDDGFTTNDAKNSTPGSVGGSLAYNLIRTTTNFFITGPQGGNITGQDPLLGPLQNNGGSTQTRALLPGSPAINAANSNAPARDQRNYIRPDVPDIGAFEFGGTIPVTLANISARAFVQTGDNVMIGGFIITGGGQKKVIVRAIGPSLVNHGITNPLQNPTLELHDHTGAVIAFNDNWMDAANKQEIINSGLAPSNNLESAILMSLDPGAYTAIVRGVSNGTGIGLVEAFDLDPTAGSKLGNISTRALVQTGNNVMIGGLIITGPDSDKVIVRAIGPSLAQFGITNPLADPTLELHDGNGVVIAFNDNWRDTQQAEIQATGLAPSNHLESAILRTLAPGNYTAIVRGKNNTIGVGLVEVYGLD